MWRALIVLIGAIAWRRWRCNAAGGGWVRAFHFIDPAPAPAPAPRGLPLPPRLILHPDDVSEFTPPRGFAEAIGFRHWLTWICATNRIFLFVIPGLLVDFAPFMAAQMLINFCRHLLRHQYAPGTVLAYSSHVVQAQVVFCGRCRVASSPLWTRFRATLSAAAAHTVNAKIGASVALLAQAVLIVQADATCAVALDASIVAFAALLRCKEYTAATRRGARPWQFRWRNVAGFARDGSRVDLDSALLFRIDITVFRKCDRGKFGQTISLFFSGDPTLCPVRALVRRYVAGATPRPLDPVFTLPNGTFLVREDVASLLKRAAAASDLDARLYSTHSLRRGGAQRLRDLGFSEAFIQVYGAWRSAAVRRYANPPADECRTVASAMFSV